MSDILITKHRKSGLNFLLIFFIYCFVFSIVFIYLLVFTDENLPLFLLFFMIPITIGIGYMLLKTDTVIEVNLNSGDLVVHLPISFSKFLYFKSEIIGYHASIKDHWTKLPINSTYIDVEIIFYTSDLKVHRISSVTTINFDTFLEYFYKTYPMVSEKELQPIEEEEKRAQNKLVLDRIFSDKRDFWKRKKKDLWLFSLIFILVIIFKILIVKYF